MKDNVNLGNIWTQDVNKGEMSQSILPTRHLNNNNHLEFWQIRLVNSVGGG